MHKIKIRPGGISYSGNIFNQVRLRDCRLVDNDSVNDGRDEDRIQVDDLTAFWSTNGPVQRCIHK